MTEKIYKNISEILPDFFSKKQVDEFIKIYRAFSSGKSAKDSSPKIKQREYKIQDGLNYRSQIDLLITFSSDRLPREKFLSLLLYLSQASITNGEYITAVDINEKIISLTVNDKDMSTFLQMLIF